MWAGRNRSLNDLDLLVLRATPEHRSTPVGRLSLLIFPHPCFKNQVHSQEDARFPVGTPAILSDVYRGLPRFLLAHSRKLLVLRHGHSSSCGVPRFVKSLRKRLSMTPGVVLQNGTSYGLESRRSSSVLFDRVWLYLVLG